MKVGLSAFQNYEKQQKTFKGKITVNFDTEITMYYENQITRLFKRK